MVWPFLVAHQMAERRVEAHNVKVIVTTCATPDSCEQTVYQLLRTLAAVGPLLG